VSLERKLDEIIAEDRRRQARRRSVPRWLRPPGEETRTAVVLGNVVRLYRTHPDCLAAGYCKWLSLDCPLYAIIRSVGTLTGWCREKVSQGCGHGGDLP